jgi:hypothetical protein
MDIPDTLVTAISGFYEEAVELDGLTFDEMVDIGVPMLFQSRCPELLAYLDRLLSESDDVVYAVWKRASSNYLFRDIEIARQILERVRARVAERVASGGGGMPG